MTNIHSLLCQRQTWGSLLRVSWSVLCFCRIQETWNIPWFPYKTSPYRFHTFLEQNLEEFDYLYMYNVSLTDQYLLFHFMLFRFPTIIVEKFKFWSFSGFKELFWRQTLWSRLLKATFYYLLKYTFSSFFPQYKNEKLLNSKRKFSVERKMITLSSFPVNSSVVLLLMTFS